MMHNRYPLYLSTIIALLLTTSTATRANPTDQSKLQPTLPKGSVHAENKTEEDDRLFDNTTMARMLQKSLELCEQSDMVAAKKEWTKVIEFMHKPRWFPTAAMVPVSLRFAKLADICLQHDQIDDSHELMHAAFEFPFHISKDEIEIDEVANRLVEYDKKTGNTAKCRTFLVYAIEKSFEPRRSKFQKWLDSLELQHAK